MTEQEIANTASQFLIGNWGVVSSSLTDVTSLASFDDNSKPSTLSGKITPP